MSVTISEPDPKTTAITVTVQLDGTAHKEHLDAGAEREEIARRIVAEAVSELQNHGVDAWKDAAALEAEKAAIQAEYDAKIAEIDERIAGKK